MGDCFAPSRQTTRNANQPKAHKLFERQRGTFFLPFVMPRLSQHQRSELVKQVFLETQWENMFGVAPDALLATASLLVMSMLHEAKTCRY
jgi:hypothetical protein